VPVGSVTVQRCARAFAIVIASGAKQCRDRGAPYDPWIAPSLRSSQ
jgi:hypothetical protein